MHFCHGSHLTLKGEMNTARGKCDHRDYTSSSSSSTSSSSPASRCDHKVFLNFRGPDTRHSINDHLYLTLEDRGILTFRDQEELQSGYQREQAVVSAIHRSKIFIVIFSKDYASSHRCLTELAMIAELMEKGNPGEIKVIPVFYRVDPSDVRNQVGMYGEAFQRHEMGFDTNTIETWKKALRWIGGFSGWRINENDYEGRMIREIAKDVFSELGNMKMRSEIANREAVEFLARRGNDMTTDFRWQALTPFSLIAAYKFPRPFHVFINHRGPDTKHSISALLHQNLTSLGVNAFLDKKSMPLGKNRDKIIETAIQECKVGLAIISPRYCASEHCLNELAMLMEDKKKVIPVFFDIQVSDLVVKVDRKYSAKQLDRFRKALKSAKRTVGIVFNSSKEDWPELIDKVSEAVMGTINRDREIEEIID